MNGHEMSAGKWAAAVTEIKLYSKQGRPVLVGTTSVERSEALAAMLQQEGALFLLGAIGWMPPSCAAELLLSAVHQGLFTFGDVSAS